MEKSLIAYHDIDVTLPSQTFNVAFSYTTKETLDFIDSMVLRLLVIAPMSAEKIAQFLELTNHETDVLLTSLLHREQIQHLEDGKFSLTKQLEKAFSDVCAIPYVNKIEDSIQKMNFEMIGLNPEPVNQNSSDNGLNSIKLEASKEFLSSSESLVYKEFQKNFRFYSNQDLIKFNLAENEDEKKVQLYKMSQVEKLRDHSRRFQLNLTFNDNATPTEINDFNHLQNVDKIEDALYSALRSSKKSENIKDIVKVLDKLDMEEYLGIESIFSHQKFHLDQLSELNHGTNHYFIGPIYSKENAELFFDAVKKCQSNHSEQKQLYWLAPSDNFWGKSDRFSDFVDRLSSNKMTNNFKCLLPVSSQDDKHSLSNYKKIITNQSGGKNFHTIRESSLMFEGNFEILVMENTFCAFIIHVSSPSKDILTTVPVGIMITDSNAVEGFFDFFKQLEAEENCIYGLLNQRK